MTTPSSPTESTTPPKTTWSLYNKAKNPPTGIQLQARDMEILKALYDYRFLQTNHLHNLINARLEQTAVLRRIQERLTKLWRNDYVFRVPLTDRVTTGSKPQIYALSDRGQYALRTAGYPIREQDFNTKNKRLKNSLILEHELMIAAFISAIEAACLKDPQLSFISQASLLQERKLESKKKPLKIILHRSQQKLIAIPDHIFGIEYQDKGISYFYLEADRGTEDLAYNPNRTTLAGKVLAYLATINQQRHIKDRSQRNYLPLGLPNFRVLFLTSRPKSSAQYQDRLENILKAYQETSEGQHSAAFLFARFQEDTSSLEHILKQAWLNGQGKCCYLA